ncbi:hypothetical protein B0O99DRAFT_16235 [Bisporella sp. PMI_857]|nr:hypothetical protein B0O99DRAFT_16235 [Bisporella sp. PMI_857]
MLICVLHCQITRTTLQTQASGKILSSIAEITFLISHTRSCSPFTMTDPSTPDSRKRKRSNTFSLPKAKQGNDDMPDLFDDIPESGRFRSEIKREDTDIPELVNDTPSYAFANLKIKQETPTTPKGTAASREPSMKKEKTASFNWTPFTSPLPPSIRPAKKARISGPKEQKAPEAKDDGKDKGNGRC